MASRKTGGKRKGAAKQTRLPLRLKSPFVEYFDRFVEPGVKQVGWAVVTFGDEKTPPVYYTIGLSAKRLPEILLLVPIEPELARMVINRVARKFVERGAVVTGDVHEIIADFPVRVRVIDVLGFLEFGARARDWAVFYGHSLDSAVQVLLPDTKGRFPGEVGYDWVEQFPLPAPGCY